jgi:hypothetical protein
MRVSACARVGEGSNKLGSSTIDKLCPERGAETKGNEQRTKLSNRNKRSKVKGSRNGRLRSLAGFGHTISASSDFEETSLHFDSFIAALSEIAEGDH